MSKESPEFISQCAAYAEMEWQAEQIALMELASKPKMMAEPVIIHLLTRLLKNG